MKSFRHKNDVDNIVFCQGDGSNAEKSALANELLQEHGGALVQALIQGSIFSLPSYMIPDSAEVLHEIMTVNKAVSC